MASIAGFTPPQDRVDFGKPIFYAIDKWVGCDGVWVRLLQEQFGRPVGVDLDVAGQLASQGCIGRFVGDLRAPETIRLVVTFSASVPIDSAIRAQLLVPCAEAAGLCSPSIFPMGGVVPIDPFAPRGPVIGAYKGMHIHDTLTSEGRGFEYDRIARETRGVISLEQLADGEMVVAPGLIYRPRGS